MYQVDIFACNWTFPASLHKGTISPMKKRNPEYGLLGKVTSCWILNFPFSPYIIMHSLSTVSSSSNLRTKHTNLPFLRLSLNFRFHVMAEHAGFTIKTLINSNTLALFTIYTTAFHKIGIMIICLKELWKQSTDYVKQLPFCLLYTWSSINGSHWWRKVFSFFIAAVYIIIVLSWSILIQGSFL